MVRFLTRSWSIWYHLYYFVNKVLSDYSLNVISLCESCNVRWFYIYYAFVGNQKSALHFNQTAEMNMAKSRLMNIVQMLLLRRNSLPFITQSKLKQRHTQDFTPMLNSMQSKSSSNKALESFDGAVITRDRELMNCTQHLSAAFLR